jgi:hypothetical protein
MWVGAVLGTFADRKAWRESLRRSEGGKAKPAFFSGGRRGRRREKHRTVAGRTVGRRPRVATPIWVGVGIAGSRRSGWGREMS